MAAGDGEGGGLLGWVKGLGLPIASLIASAAFFGIQMQQQAFERRLKNVEDGYRFYFEERTALQASADVDTEQALLEMLGAAFPTVYCNVRADMYKRAVAAETASASDADARRFTDADRDAMVTFIIANRTPASADFSTDFGSLMPWARSPTPQECTADFDVAREQVAEAPASEEEAAVAEGSPPAATAPASETPAPREAPRLDPAVRARIGERTDAAREIVERAYAPRAQTYQVFFHIRDGSGRTAESIDPLRAPLAQANFRVMRGVRVVPAAGFPSRAVVRYFGPDQEAAANELVAALNAHFEGEGLTFQTRAIGAQYPNMPPTHLEVWIP
jgi:hypothetical protein